MRYLNYALSNNNVTYLEEENKKLSLECAKESIILLRNENNILPLKEKEIDLFGNGANHTIKGGLGSGEVNEYDVNSIYDSLIENGYIIKSENWLNKYEILYQKEIKKYKKSIQKSIYHLDFINFMGQRLDFIPGDLLTDSDINSKTCIYVISRFSGEGKDLTKNEYMISDIEYNNLLFCSKKYKNIILILNIGGFFDLSFTDEIENINGIIYMGNLGKMGAQALVSILKDTSPSGRLPITSPNKYDDIPFSNEFSYNSNSLDSNYNEGIYVGYRYYDTFKKDIRYPFGYGLSYSKFEINNFKYENTNSIIKIYFDIKNIGNYKAKETILFFLEAPKKIGEEKSLIAYYKTLELNINEIEKCYIEFDIFDFSYTLDDKRLLNEGIYIIRYGENVSNTIPIYKFKIEEDFILYKIDKISSFESKIKKEIKPADLNIEEIKLNLFYKKKNYSLNNNFDNIKNLTLKEKINLCVGSGLLPKPNYISVAGIAGYTTNKIENIPALAMADGPAGIRLSTKVKIKNNGKLKQITPSMDIYNYLPSIFKFFKYSKNKKNVGYLKTTSFPTGISLAATFNKDLIKKVGIGISKELSSIGISYYLAPAANIIKNPIGGRSFEYFSEDPFLSGMTSASFINGIEQKEGQYAVMKHFACNNLEFMRNNISANVSNEALKDIYLKSFEIAIKYSSLSHIMSSYNKINQKYVANDSYLLNDILRKEYGFNGVVMTDWLSTGKKYASNYLAIKSGNDLIMPGSKKAYNDIYKAYKKKLITIEELNRASSNILKSICKTSIFKKYKIKK